MVIIVVSTEVGRLVFEPPEPIVGGMDESRPALFIAIYY